jgi:hypothetical protein
MLSLLALTTLLTTATFASVTVELVPETTVPAPPPAVPPPPVVTAQPGPNAAAPLVPVAPPSNPGSRWYGGPALMADIASPVLLLFAAGTNQADLGLLVLAAYTFGAPINHLAHDHPGRALGSLALRVAALATSAAILTQTLAGECGNEEIPNKPSYCGLEIGFAVLLPLATMIVDDAVFAREPAAAAPPSRFTFNPGLSIGRNGGLMSLGGTF